MRRSWSSWALFLDSIGSLDRTVILNHVVDALSTHELGPAECAKRLNNFGHILTWMMDLGAFQPVLGRKFHVESEFEVRFSGF